MVVCIGVTLVVIGTLALTRRPCPGCNASFYKWDPTYTNVRSTVFKPCERCGGTIGFEWEYFTEGRLLPLDPDLFPKGMTDQGIEPRAMHAYGTADPADHNYERLTRLCDWNRQHSVIPMDDDCLFALEFDAGPFLWDDLESGKVIVRSTMEALLERYPLFLDWRGTLHAHLLPDLSMNTNPVALWRFVYGYMYGAEIAVHVDRGIDFFTDMELVCHPPPPPHHLYQFPRSIPVYDPRNREDPVGRLCEAFQTFVSRVRTRLDQVNWMHRDWVWYEREILALEDLLEVTLYEERTRPLLHVHPVARDIPSLVQLRTFFQEGGAFDNVKHWDHRARDIPRDLYFERKGCGTHKVLRMWANSLRYMVDPFERRIFSGDHTILRSMPDFFRFVLADLPDPWREGPIEPQSREYRVNFWSLRQQGDLKSHGTIELRGGALHASFYVDYVFQWGAYLVALMREALLEPVIIVGETRFEWDLTRDCLLICTTEGEECRPRFDTCKKT